MFSYLQYICNNWRFVAMHKQIKILLILALFAIVFVSCEKKIVQAPGGNGDSLMELRGDEFVEDDDDGVIDVNDDIDSGVHDGDDDEDFDNEDSEDDPKDDESGRLNL